MDHEYTNDSAKDKTSGPDHQLSPKRTTKSKKFIRGLKTMKSKTESMANSANRFVAVNAPKLGQLAAAANTSPLLSGGLLSQMKYEVVKGSPNKRQKSYSQTEPMQSPQLRKSEQNFGQEGRNEYRTPQNCSDDQTFVDGSVGTREGRCLMTVCSEDQEVDVESIEHDGTAPTHSEAMIAASSSVWCMDIEKPQPLNQEINQEIVDGTSANIGNIKELDTSEKVLSEEDNDRFT